jgi:hypothetical protein
MAGKVADTSFFIQNTGRLIAAFSSFIRRPFLTVFYQEDRSKSRLSGFARPFLPFHQPKGKKIKVYYEKAYMV